MTAEERKSKWGPPEGYPDRVRLAMLHVPYEAIDWLKFPDEQLRELVAIMGGDPEQPSRRRLESVARRTVYRFQRDKGLHRRQPLANKIAAAPGPPSTAAVAIAKRKRAWA
ncbi:MAG TPA: hypothetical protein VH744_13510 [Terriglobales bacterium]|jgi:hypothetical protein